MNTPTFPTQRHQIAAEAVGAFFISQAAVDTVLVVNSCARGQAEPESDLDFAILVKPATPPAAIQTLATAWQAFARTAPAVRAYQQSSAFAQIHLDVITGAYVPGAMEAGGPLDYFEVEIGNQVAQAAPLGRVGAHWQALRDQWLPYYAEGLRAERLAMARAACAYDLAHLPSYVRRGLPFYAFDRLYAAFQKYLQAAFIAGRTYPIAYNKWIKEQVVDWLKRPDLYPRLAPILSVAAIESEEVLRKAEALQALLNDLPAA